MTISKASGQSRVGYKRMLHADGAGRRQLLAAAVFAGLSLALGVIAVAAGTPPALLPFVLALGPTVIAIVLALGEGHGALRRLLHTVNIRPARRRWYLVLLVPVAWSLATVGIAVATGEPTVGLFDAVFPAILIIPLVVLLPAFAEELAWRGYVLPRLLSSMSPLRAALVLAVPWSLIHVLLLLPGQWYAELAIWPMVLSIFAYSILLTWVFVRTGGSVLMTALLHTGLNGVAPIMGGLDANDSWIIRNVLAALIALAVIGLGGFSHSRSETSEGAAGA